MDWFDELHSATPRGSVQSRRQVNKGEGREGVTNRCCNKVNHRRRTEQFPEVTTLNPALRRIKFFGNWGVCASEETDGKPLDNCRVLKGTVKVDKELQRYKPVFKGKYRLKYLSVDTFQGVYVVSVFKPIRDMKRTIFTGFDFIGHGDDSAQAPLDLGTKITEPTFGLPRVSEIREETMIRLTMDFASIT